MDVTARLIGKSATEPDLGDWPLPETKSAAGWEQIIFDFRVANEELIRVCEGFDPKLWDDKTVDESNLSPGSAVSYAELLNGLVQHHAYHAGQISLLSKF